MGNTLRPGYQSIPDNIKLGTMMECIANAQKNGVQIKKYTGIGDTVEDAIIELTDKCREHHIPEPQQSPRSIDEWYCGSFEVPPAIPFITQKTIKHNTVWFTIKNQKIVAYVFF